MLRAVRASQLLQAFSSDRKKIQTVGFSNSHIESVKSLGYKLKQPIKFAAGKFLIYRSRPSWLRVLVDYLPHLAAVILCGSLIYTRYNMDVFPVVFHAYVGGIALTLFFFMRKYLKMQSVVKEIYLLEGGKATQIVFRNALKRKMFGEPLSVTYYNSLFVPPPQTADSWRILHEFPRDLETLTPAQQMGTYWKKYYSNDGNFILVPQRYELMHSEILSQVMNGKVIIC